MQTFARWNSDAEDIRHEVLTDAYRILGEKFMDRLLVGLGTLEPEWPAAAAPPGPFTVDRMRAPVAAIESARPKRRRVRKAQAVQASELGPVA